MVKGRTPLGTPHLPTAPRSALWSQSQQLVLLCTTPTGAVADTRRKFGMENGEREVRVGSDAKARLKKKNKKREKAIKVGGCTSGIGTSSDLTRRPMTPTKEKAKCHTRMGEAAVGAAGAAGGKKVKGSEEGRAISLPSVSGNKRPREGEEVAAAVQGGTSKSKHHPFPTEYGDHFETPLQAYRDVEGALAVLSKLLSKKKKHLRIWDPYVSLIIPTVQTHDYSQLHRSNHVSLEMCEREHTSRV